MNKEYNLLVSPKKEHHVHHFYGCDAYEYCEKYGEYTALYPHKVYQAKYDPEHTQDIIVKYGKSQHSINWYGFRIVNYNLEITPIEIFTNGSFFNICFNKGTNYKAIEADESKYLVEVEDIIYSVPKNKFEKVELK